MNISLTSEANEIVSKTVSERKKGEWISKAVIAYAQTTQFDDKGALERLEAKLDRVLTLLSSGKQCKA